MTGYSDIRTVCFDCAISAGFEQNDKVIGVWIAECDICHEQKPCTDLFHDWEKHEGGAK